MYKFSRILLANESVLYFSLKFPECKVTHTLPSSLPAFPPHPLSIKCLHTLSNVCSDLEDCEKEMIFEFEPLRKVAWVETVKEDKYVQ